MADMTMSTSGAMATARRPAGPAASFGGADAGFSQFLGQLVAEFGGGDDGHDGREFANLLGEKIDIAASHQGIDGKFVPAAANDVQGAGTDGTSRSK
jgi:hypothetical protein